MITSSGFVSSNDNGDSYPDASVQLISISPLFQINRAVKMCLMILMCLMAVNLMGSLSMKVFVNVTSYMFYVADVFVSKKMTSSPWDCSSIVGDVSFEGAV